jgi:hypothetical protein
MKDKYRICISSPPDRKKLVAEIFFGNVQWAEMNQERGDFEIEFYPRVDGTPWRIDFSSVISALNEAKKRLAGE